MRQSTCRRTANWTIRLLVAGTVPTAAWALSEPVPGPKDAHVRTVAYDPQNRTQLVIQQGMVTNITFGVMELIDHVVLAETAPFGYQNCKQDQNCPELINNLQIIGKTPGASNLVVVTHEQPAGKERVYNIAIRSLPAAEGEYNEATYQLTFTYSPTTLVQGPIPVSDPASPRVMTWKEKKAQADAELAIARARADVTFGPQNRNYLAQGKARAMAPVEAFDNGQLTAFRYPGAMAIPGVYKVIGTQNGMPPSACGGKPDLEGKEEAVNVRMVNNLLIVDSTYPYWRLRNGEDVINVYNCGYTIPIAPPESTVIRRIVQR